MDRQYMLVAFHWSVPVYCGQSLVWSRGSKQMGIEKPVYKIGSGVDGVCGEEGLSEPSLHTIDATSIV